MSKILDPATGQAVPSTQPNMHDIPCECGCVNRVEVHTPRFYNLPQTSFVVSEHCGPTICPGCLRAVAVCIISIGTVMLKCVPINGPKAVRPGLPEVPLPSPEGEPAADEENASSKLPEDRVM